MKLLLMHALGEKEKKRYANYVRSLLFILLLLFSFTITYSQSPTFEPESREAWDYMLEIAENVVPRIYDVHDQGLSCKLSTKETKQTLETLSFEMQRHPSELAESVAAYFWSDWTLLHVEGYDIYEIVEEDADPKALEAFLEAFYQQHEPCLLSTMRVLIDGYEGYYLQQPNGEYTRMPRKRGEPYQVLALSTDYFPGNGILEPLGIVYGVRLAGLLQMDFIRKPALEAVTLSISKRLNSNGDALKIF